ncbi:unnamed protein product [Rodentolepis nana]|uniref:Intraflagellar transport protein 74 homolog n=1 Tax=Rodentolepis nana TaxID=102285 RepID=A0A0R3TYF9_RODNA|nr:unnamed protein product [Rodentolepis nana]
MRSSDSKRSPMSANILPIETATRLTTSLLRDKQLNQQRLRTPTSRGGSVLNTELAVESRPKTGILGIKSTNPKSSLQFRRRIEDRSYYIGLLRERITAITVELKTIMAEYSVAEEEARSFGHYEKMAENLAAELRDLQGELGDYNTLIDKATLGHDLSSIELDWEDLKAANDRAEVSLEHHFEKRKKAEDQLKSAQIELEQERRIAECIIEDMDDEQKAKYLKLRNQSDFFLQQLSTGHSKLTEMLERCNELELEISTSSIRQEALCIFRKLRDVEAKRDQLQAEEDNKEDPQIEKERLLAKIKEDNRETASMEREIRELNERIQVDELLLNQLCTQLSDQSANERDPTVMELNLRKAQINDFFSAKHQIVKALGRCSQYIANIEQAIGSKTVSEANMDAVEDQLNEPSKSENTAEALDTEKSMLLNYLKKIDQLEIKVTEELEALKTNVMTIESDLNKLNNIASNDETSEERKASLLKEIEKLKETRANLAVITSQLEAQNTSMEANLNSNETHIQLCTLEKRLTACETRKQALSKAIETKKFESDYSFTAMKAKSLLADYNQALKTELMVKPLAL